MSSILFGAWTRLAQFVGPTNIPLAATLTAVSFPGRSSGRVALRFKASGGDATLGDGAAGHALGIVAQRTVGDAATANPEMIGFAGILLGGVSPQVPLRNVAGAAPLEWTQIVELADGYGQLGVCSFGALVAVAGGTTIEVWVAPILDDSPSVGG